MHSLSSRPVLVALVLLLAAPALAARDRSTLELTVRDEQGDAVAEAAVEVTSTAPTDTRAAGSTDRRGRFRTDLPDYARVYRLRIEREGFRTFDQEIDFAAQNLPAGRPAELAVTLDAWRGPTPAELYNEGVAALRAGDVATAEAKLLEVTGLAPEIPQAWMVLATLAAESRRWPEALARAERALALAPPEPLALRARYDALLGLGRAEEAEAALDALVAVDSGPETARLLFNSGVTAWSAKDGERARRRFAAAVAADPQLHQAHSAIAEIHIAGEDFAAALAAVERALAIAPRDRKARERRIELLRALGREDEAEAASAELEGG
jgi:tetratricopeptide (TPR) repeat protein